MTTRSITFVTSSAPYHPGPQARILPIAAAAAAAGWEVTLLCLDPHWSQHGPRNTTVDGVTVRTVAQMHVRPDGTPFHGLVLLWVALRAIAALTRATGATRPAVVVIAKALPLNGIAAQCAAVLTGARLVLDCDDAEADSHRAADWVIRALRWYETRLPRWVASTTSASTWLATRMCATGIQRVTVIPNGFSAADAHRPDTAAAAPFAGCHNLPSRAVVYVGSLRTSSHAVDLLLQAYARSARTVPLVIAGSGPDADALRALAATLGIAAHVIWLGSINRSAVPLLLSHAVLSVDPVRDDAAAAGRFPLKIIESLAHGVPVLTSPVGDRADHWHGGLCLAAAGDPDAYALALDAALLQPIPADDCRAAAAPYRWERLTAAWYAAHDIVLGGADAHR